MGVPKSPTILGVSNHLQIKTTIYIYPLYTYISNNLDLALKFDCKKAFYTIERFFI